MKTTPVDHKNVTYCKIRVLRTPWDIKRVLATRVYSQIDRLMLTRTLQKISRNLLTRIRSQIDRILVTGSPRKSNES